MEIDRRGFLGMAATFAGGVLLASCSKGGSSYISTQELGLPVPHAAPFDTVVVVMMENRSFDHILGWLPGADGRQAGLRYIDAAGVFHPTHHLRDFQGCDFYDPRHDVRSVSRQWNHGKCNGFLITQPVGDTYPIGYYEAADLPITAALARGHTVCDRYHCSVMGPTGPNRMYAWSGTTDYFEFDGSLTGAGERPSDVKLAIFDRLQDAGVSHVYYAGKEPHSYAFKSKRYDVITRPHAEFFDAARTGTLPNVTYLDPDLSSVAETVGTAYDDHPFGDVRAGDAWIAKVYNALAHSPQWDRMLFVLTFDEHGGFFDHVPPPPVEDDTDVDRLKGVNLKHMGFRVPCILGGAFAPAGVHHGGPYDHCSILRMIEWRWGLKPMRARDRTAANLAHAFDFSRGRKPIKLPAVHAPAAHSCTTAQITRHVTEPG
ncbi:MAG TPA: alkaline phosphatase family protein [Acidimicrobiia bacterium]|nr:alkaline phosphatase family protein [Acidimicrobiia bacterium]